MAYMGNSSKVENVDYLIVLVPCPLQQTKYRLQLWILGHISYYLNTEYYKAFLKCNAQDACGACQHFTALG